MTRARTAIRGLCRRGDPDPGVRSCPRVLRLRSRLSKRPARACRRYGTIVVWAVLKAVSRAISSAGALAFRDKDDRLMPRRKEIRTALGNYQTDKHSSVKTSLAGRLAGTIISLPRTPPGSTTLLAGPRASASFRGVPALSAGCCAGVRGHTQAHRHSSRSFQWRRSCITCETRARGRTRTLATGLFG